MSVPTAQASPSAPPVAKKGWFEEVRAQARKRDALILAHNYQAAAIQDVADHVGDSLALARLAAASDAGTIVLAGVLFMAETAKILCPEKTVLIPDKRAGCSLADSITADQLRVWKSDHPGAVVVAYVNTSAEVKAETDICCTSSNAVDVVKTIPEDREILFLPDQFLGAHVQRMTGRKNMHIWMGECHVHAGISPDDLRKQVAANPDAELLIHPECGCTTSTMFLAGAGDLPAERTHILSTGGMLEHARHSNVKTALVATEVGMLHQLRMANPRTNFQAMNPNAVCKYMAMTTEDALLRCVTDGVEEVDVPADIAGRARAAVQGMVAVGTPSPVGE